MMIDGGMAVKPATGWNRFIGLGSRYKYTKMTWLTSILSIALYFLGMLALLMAPLGALVQMTKVKAYSSLNGDVLTLTDCGGYALGFLTALTFALSVSTGGLGRALLKRDFVYGWVVALAGLGMLWGLTFTLDEFRRIASKIAAIEKGDNARFAAFMAFWVLMIGYAGKAIWDELRDRISDSIESIIPKVNSLTHSGESRTASTGESAMSGPEVAGQARMLSEVDLKSIYKMISRLSDDEVTAIYDAVGREGPVADLASGIISDRHTSLSDVLKRLAIRIDSHDQ